MQTLTVLHTFDPFLNVPFPRDGTHPAAGLYMDAQGDLFGTTEFGGSAGQGTIFEIANVPLGGYSSPFSYSIQLNFNGVNGATPVAGFTNGPRTFRQPRGRTCRADCSKF